MEHEPVADVPPLVPARMVNEFVYCPRFFHLAWSSGESGENDYTAEGKFEHRIVDREAGTPPAAGSAEGSERSTSVLVSSDRLGVIAKADIIERRGTQVVPVELKRGKARDPDHPVWEPELVQMIVTAMVLRDNGYDVPHCEVRFTESTTRAILEISDERIANIERVLAELRSVAADPLPPSPLIDSPKCPACIMNGACLPDEHQSIRTGTSASARRLIPEESATSPLYVTEPGARIGVKGKHLTIKKGSDKLADLRFLDVSHVAIFGNVQISTQAMRELFFREIPICYFSGNGWFQGIAEGLPGKNVELRRRQAWCEEGERLDIARSMVRGKILNARVLLRRNAKDDVADVVNELKRMSRFATTADSFERLLGVEGGAARLYFSRFSTMLSAEQKPTFDYVKRTRRPPTDPINCLLSYVYGLLVKDCTTTLLAVGFDPYQGVYHRPRFGRPALALDVAEEFRPLLADSTVLTLVNNGEVTDRNFVRRAGAVSLTAEGRRSVLAAYERRLSTEFTHPIFKYNLTYRRAIEVQARLLSAKLSGELDDYVSLVTR